MKHLLAAILIASSAHAGDYCYVCQPNYAYPPANKVKINNTVQVVTRQQNLTSFAAKENIEQELALERQWEMLTDSIPVSPGIDQFNLFRRHQFAQNIQQHVAVAKHSEQIQTRSATKTYTGYLKQSFSVSTNGEINFNLSDHSHHHDHAN